MTASDDKYKKWSFIRIAQQEDGFFGQKFIIFKFQHDIRNHHQILHLLVSNSTELEKDFFSVILEPPGVKK
jgi:hypothetical protein